MGVAQRFLLFLLLLPGAVHTQKSAPPLPSDTLARVGPSVITARDLIERMELMPWEGKETPGKHDSAKIKALNSLVAERLLALQGTNAGIGVDEQAQLKVREMEKLFVRDELFTREVKQKITVSQKEINEGLTRFAWQLHVAAVAVRDVPAGEALYGMLKKNIPLAAALRTMDRGSYSAPETVQVNFGGLDTLFEDAVYRIGSKKFSRPFMSSTYGWTIAVILDRGTNPVYEKMSPADRRTRVDEVIRLKKQQVIAGRFFSRTMAPQKARTDSVLFYRLADALRTILNEAPLRQRTNGLFAVTSPDVDRLTGVFLADLRRPFIGLASDTMTLGETIEAMRAARLGFPSLEPLPFARALSSHLRTLVGSDVMSREGYKRNLQHSRSVQHDVQTWDAYWRSRYMMWKVKDSITVKDEEILSALRANLRTLGSVYQVNIQEVLLDSLSTARRVLALLAGGSSMDEIVRQYSQRAEWKEQNGISGFMSLTRHPELASAAFVADSGALVGPVSTPQGYSLFRVLGKRGGNQAEFPSPDSVVINIRNNLLGKKHDRVMTSYVAALAKEYTVDIRYHTLNSITIQPANMVVRRMIGFGGTITAVPMLYPNWEWMKEYRESSAVNP